MKSRLFYAFFLALDRETTDIFEFEVQASDGELSSSVSVTIIITDVNDNPPTFNTSNYITSANENFTIGSSILKVQATDKDDPLINGNGNFSFSIQSGNIGSAFGLNPVTGQIYLANGLDYELIKLYKLIVVAVDSHASEESKTGSTMIMITVEPSNDNSPMFHSLPYFVSIPENLRSGSSIFKVSATDADDGNDGRMFFTMNNHPNFKLDSETGIIYVKSPPNYEIVEERSFLLSISATDMGVPARNASITLLVNVTDINDASPECVPKVYSKSLREDIQISSYVLTLSCADEDAEINGVLEYSVVESLSSNFDVNATSGTVFVNSSLDAERANNQIIVIKVSDKGTPILSTSATIVINIIDVNEHFPVFDNSTENITIAENLSIGSSIAQLSAKDGDLDDKVTYSIITVTDTFIINLDTGEIKLSKELNREITNIYYLTVRAIDNGIIDGLRNTDHNLTVIIGDINEHPVFSPSTYVAVINENFTLNNTVATVTAYDNDLESFGDIDYSIFSGNDEGKFFIKKNNENKGDIILLNSLDYESTKDYSLIVHAFDKGSPPLTALAMVTVRVQGANEAPPVFGSNFSKSVSELAKVGYLIQTETAVDADDGIDGQIVYELVDGDISVFSIDPVTADIKLKSNLDREKKDSYSVTIQAKDLGSPAKYGTAFLFLTVTDENDRKPECDPSALTKAVAENHTGAIFALNCTDLDSEQSNFNVLSYSLSGTDQSSFEINVTSGEVTLRSNISFDYETKNSYSFLIDITDGGGNILNVPAVIQIIGLNEYTPTFSESKFYLNISEGTLISTTVGSFTAVDDDFGEDGELRYKILSGNQHENFRYDSKTGDLYLAKQLDRDIPPEAYTLVLLAIDNGLEMRTGSAILIVFVTDINDNFPNCNRSLYYGEITEGITTNGFSIVSLSDYCSDIDHGLNAHLAFSIIAGNSYGIFDIDIITGEIIVGNETAINAEQALEYYLLVKVADGGIPENFVEVFVSVKVNDRNEAPPTFIDAPYNAYIREDSVLYTSVYKLSANDPDKEVNGKFSFSITSGNDEQIFHINSDTGLIFLNQTLDRESYELHNLSVKVIDKGVNKLYSETSLTIYVLDYNDNSPNCSAKIYLQTLNESCEIGTHVVQVLCSDIDNGSNADLVYSIFNGNPKNQFTINKNTGDITTSAKLDYEDIKSYSLIILIEDKADVGPIRTSSVTAVINTSPVNEHSPVILGSYNIIIPENAIIGYLVTTISTLDADDRENFHGIPRFYIVSGNSVNQFAIDEFTGKILITKSLDREDVDAYHLEIEVQDSLRNKLDVKTSSVNVTIEISDVNDNYPVLIPAIYSITVSEATPIGQTILSITAQDDDDRDNAKLTYSFISGNIDSVFAFNSEEVTLVKKLDYERKNTYVIRVAVADSGSPALTSQALITINVLSFNEYPPVLSETSTSVRISESIAVGSYIYTVRATDLDNGQAGNIRYEITSGNPSNSHFLIEPITGTITVGTQLDYDGIYKTYLLKITANDMQGLNIDAKSQSMNVTIILSDVNDNWPTFTKNTYIHHLRENVEPNQLITSVLANDLDSFDFGTIGEFMVFIKNCNYLSFGCRILFNWR